MFKYTYMLININVQTYMFVTVQGRQRSLTYSQNK